MAEESQELIDVNPDAMAVAADALDLYRRIATYKANGISDTALCESFGIDYAGLSAVYTNPAYMEIEKEILSAKIDADLETDGDWDSLEAKALKNLTSVAMVNKDPELNLRIAAVANKAVRRNRVGNVTLDASKAEGARATIVLTERMVGKLGGTQDDTIMKERKVEAHLDMSNEAIEEMFAGDKLGTGLMTLGDVNDS